MLAALRHRGKYPHQAVKDILYDWDAAAVRAGAAAGRGGRPRRDAAGRLAGTTTAAPQATSSTPCGTCCRCWTAACTPWSTTCATAAWTRTCWSWCWASSAARRRSRSPGPGREHWADAGCAVLCGGGLQMGQVIGETDSPGRARDDRQHHASRTSWRRSTTSWASTRGRSCPTSTAGRSTCSTTASRSASWSFSGEPKATVPRRSPNLVCLTCQTKIEMSPAYPDRNVPMIASERGQHGDVADESKGASAPRGDGAGQASRDHAGEGVPSCWV